jgi:hypothetical protein
VATAPTHLQSNQLARWNAWKASPRPRIVRLKRGYRFWNSFLVAVCVIIPSLQLWFLIVEWRASPVKKAMNSELWDTAPFIVLPLFGLLFACWSLIAHKRLVMHGEISVGRVTSVRLRRGGRTITYEFLDNSGRLITASSPDYTRSLSPEMVIAIFYNSESPETDQVALCGSEYEVDEVR